MLETGDTANKIGTFSLALAAARHSVPFFVAAPLTSVDFSLTSGSGIVVEERSPLELTHSLGGRGPQVAPEGIRVWNPAFDITPADLITAIITDKVRHPTGLDVWSFNQHLQISTNPTAAHRGLCART